MTAILDAFKTGSSSPPETAELEAQIRYDVLGYAGARGASVRSEIRAGNGLIKLKETVAHGEWLPALGRCGLTERSAQRFMYIARHAPRVADFSSVRQAEAAIRAERRQQQEAEAEAALEAERRQQQEAEAAGKVVPATRRILARVARASLPLGTLYEGTPRQQAAWDQARERELFYAVCDYMKRVAVDLPRYAALSSDERLKVESKKHPHKTFAGLRANLKIISDALAEPEASS